MSTTSRSPRRKLTSIFGYSPYLPAVSLYPTHPKNIQLGELTMKDGHLYNLEFNADPEIPEKIPKAQNMTDSFQIVG
jgi:hypothetical protein